jgi:hypothetical protein
MFKMLKQLSDNFHFSFLNIFVDLRKEIFFFSGGIRSGRHRLAIHRLLQQCNRLSADRRKKAARL